MKKITVIFLLTVFSAVLCVQGARSATITGQCFLQGETDHSGTMVLFNAVSGSAVTVTDSIGDFTPGVAEGIYTVDFSRNGFIPFNPVTTIQYMVPEASEIQLVVYDLLGKPVRTLVNGIQKPGIITVE